MSTMYNPPRRTLDEIRAGNPQQDPAVPPPA